MSLGVYIQVPFCQAKCTYCNFHTGVFSPSLYEPYVFAVCTEISRWKNQLADINFGSAPPPEDDSAASGNALRGSVNSVYIGGGTPSLLEPAALARLLDSIRAAFPCALEEVTLEADPETVTAAKVAAWHAAGFDRVSMGVQSFNDAELRAAGRRHLREDVFSAWQRLRDAGFRNVSFDLIAGLPLQSAASWKDSLDQFLRLRPEHVSVYMMEIDEGSRLGREVLAGGTRYSAAALPDDDAIADFYELACSRMAAEGYEHYEISNWALPGRRSLHNLKYWRREPYLGLGAGAHSFDGLERWANPHDPAEYVAAMGRGGLPAEQRERLTARQALEEELFLGLRQLEGIDLAGLEKRYNVSLGERVEPLRTAGLVELEGSRLRLAPARLAVSTEVFLELLG